MKNKKKSELNYLDFIPKHNEKHTWKADENGAVTIFIENKGVFNKNTFIHLLFNSISFSKVKPEQDDPAPVLVFAVRTLVFSNKECYNDK